MDTITLIFEMTGTIAFAISGAMIGIEKKMDILGVAILGVTTAVGGGTIRDVLLGNTPPSAFVNPVYIAVASVVSILVFIPALRVRIQKNKKLFDKVLLLMDSAGLAIFTVIGISVAKNIIDSNGFLAVFVGVLTGVGGGVLRDIMASQTPYIFKKHFYCMAAIIGSIITLVVWRATSQSVAMIAGTASIFTLRVLAAHYRWELPKA